MLSDWPEGKAGLIGFSEGASKESSRHAAARHSGRSKPLLVAGHAGGAALASSGAGDGGEVPVSVVTVVVGLRVVATVVADNEI